VKRDSVIASIVKPRIRWLLFLLAVVTLTATAPVFAASSNSMTEAETVTYCQLLKTPTAYDGKLIRITGVYLYSVETQRLLSSSCCEDRDPGTWVEFGELDPKSRKRVHHFPEGTGMVLGTFVGRLGHSSNPQGSQFTLTVTAVENVERVAKGSQIKKAAWAPPFCKQ